ncbi:collagen alpha-1(XII) chain-like [Haliotis rubra]|uniref:collagen alpha-1(XII) chain-like n=1 Tax=Haliotis rubra TaxID=36100 RepID=UPI001EE53C0B|nr:collagen alpha-1(XII) chain-like [Haliotis rubra]
MHLVLFVWTHRHSDLASLSSAIARIQKTGQTTNTAAAIDVVTSSIFTASEGARANAKRVTVLLTDGASGDRPATVAAAQKAKDKGVIMFTVGVGSVNEEELNNVASQPSCTHFYKLNSFGEIDHLVYDIKKRSCTAPKVISATSDDDTPSSVTTPLSIDPVRNTYVLHPNNSVSQSGTEKVIKTDVECGILNVYASYDTPNPGPAFYSVTSQVVDGRPSIMKVNTTREGRPLFVTVIGTKLQESCSDILKCRDAKFSLSVEDAPVTSVAEVLCRTWEGERTCTEADLVNNGFLVPSCPPTTSTVDLQEPIISNPCISDVTTASNGFQPHPTDATKFIVCDIRGNMYITNCPSDGIFNSRSNTCNNAPVFSLADTVIYADPNLDYICNDMLVPSKMHFPHPTNKALYIQCSLLSVAFVRPCGNGTVYNDDIQNCADVASDPVKVKVAENPCKTARVGSLHAHSDPKKFLQCTSFASYAIKSCGMGTRWDDVLKTCGW